MCVLHVRSRRTSFMKFLEGNDMPVYQSHDKGDISAIGKRLPHDDYGFSCGVSDREWVDFAGQIEDAHKFLREYEESIRELRDTHDVDELRFDFPYSCRLDAQIVVQCDYLPPELLRLAGELGVGIEMSLYPKMDDEGSESGSRGSFSPGPHTT